jgi:hypothetical protein
LTIARAILPVRDLAAGRYVARASVSAEGRPASVMTRAFTVPDR